MIWLTWRQHRGEVLVAILLFAVLAALLVLSGRDMFAAYQQVQHGTSVAACALHHSQDPICDGLMNDFRSRFGEYGQSSTSMFLLLLTLLPGLAGMFLGAPLVAREVERGTQFLVWTQSVTRLRWFVTKVVGVVVITLVAFAALSILITWWRGPLDQAIGSQFSYGFDLEGVAPVAYALFALAVGIAAGALVRKTLPAMAITLGSFVGLRGIIEFALRPQYLAPIAGISDPAGISVPGQSNPQAYNGDWVLNNGFSYLDRHGHAITSADAVNLCGSPAKGVGADFSTCLHDEGIRRLNLYQPADRFWLFQGIETAIFLIMAAALLALAIWWVRRQPA